MQRHVSTAVFDACLVTLIIVVGVDKVLYTLSENNAQTKTLEDLPARLYAGSIKSS